MGIRHSVFLIAVEWSGFNIFFLNVKQVIYKQVFSSIQNTTKLEEKKKHHRGNFSSVLMYAKVFNIKVLKRVYKNSIYLYTSKVFTHI